MKQSQQIQPLMTKKQIVLLIILLIVFLPAGIIYLSWITEKKTGLFLSLGCFGTPVLLVVLYIFCVTFPAEIGENVSHVDWLQEDASEISYYRSYMWTAYEFKVSEESFLKHANPLWEFEEISEPVTISRYKERLLNINDFPDYGAFEKEACITVKNGIVSTTRRKNGGGYIAVYDRDTGKAYIQTNPR